MTLRLALAPLWLRLLANVGIGCAMGALALVFWEPSDPRPPREDAAWWVGVMLAGAAFGTLITVISQIQSAEWHAAVKDVAPPHYRSITKALVRGPLPTDPTIRFAAARLADLYLRRAEQLRSPFFGRLAIGMICMWTAMAVPQTFGTNTNPAVLAMNLPLWVCFAVRIYYLIPLIEARRALMLNAEGAQV